MSVTASRCPDLDRLQQLAMNQLDAKEAFELQRHLVRCAVCRDTVESFKAANQVLTVPHERKPLDTAASQAQLTGSGPPPGLSAPPPSIAAPESRLSINEGQSTSFQGGDSPADFLAPPQAPDEIGRLGPYRVLKILGTGGMGVVFAAEDPNLQRKVALKALRPNLMTDGSSRQRFLQEARAAAAIEHERIVTIYQVGEDRGVPFLAMQLLQGESLEDRLTARKVLPTPEVLRIGREIAEGLAAAHERGLIHRDIKPSNIWLETQGPNKPGRVKILDFGLARAGGSEDHLTKTGFVVGTAGYISPEQARGLPVDSRSDLFSLGCVLYETCTGVTPFQGMDTMARLTALAVEQPVAPIELKPDIHPKLNSLVLRLLIKEVDKRPSTAHQVVSAITAIEGSLEKTEARPAEPARERTARAPAPPADETGTSSALVIGMIGLVLLGLGVLLFILVQ
ncbi:MAG: serine/threonine-protein kinase [Gemmataceae bacterium]